MINRFFVLNERACARIYLSSIACVRLSVYVCVAFSFVKSLCVHWSKCAMWFYLFIAALYALYSSEKPTWSNDWHNFISWLHIVLVFAFSLCVFSLFFSRTAVHLLARRQWTKSSKINASHWESGSSLHAYRQNKSQTKTAASATAKGFYRSQCDISASIWCNTHRISSHTHTCSKISAYISRWTFEFELFSCCNVCCVCHSVFWLK